MGRATSKKSLEKGISKAMKSSPKKKSGSAKGEGKKSSKSAFRRNAAAELPKRGGKRYGGEERSFWGTFSYSGNGYGFVRPEDPDREDVYVAEEDTDDAMTGDRVMVCLYPYEATKGYVKSIERKISQMIGTVRYDRFSGRTVFEPDNTKFNVTMGFDDMDPDARSLTGKRILVVPEDGEFFERTPEGLCFKVKEILGEADDPSSAYKAALISNGIKTEFPKKALEEADLAAGEKPVFPDKAGMRRDLRDEIIFTIDGAGAKDLDDAISLREDGDDWILGVHIADVSHYVRQGMAVEKEAEERGTSVYFTDKVVPMLPKALSNGICSLNGGVDRYSVSAEIRIGKDGTRKDTEIFKSIIRSRVRGVYTEVNDLFENGKESGFYGKYSEVFDSLMRMKELYLVLRDVRARSAVLDIDDTEADIILDENGKPVEILPRERGDGEKLIEEFMLQANMGVAETLKTLSLPCVYRTHEAPDEKSIREFADKAVALGFADRELRDAGYHSKKDPLSYIRQLAEALERAEASGCREILSYYLLRSMMKAKYSAQCAPHFGLGVSTYCHFTSPIRRYPDLFVHSIITAVLEGMAERSPGTGVPVLNARSLVTDLKDRTAHFRRIANKRAEDSTDAELRAVSAERMISSIYMAMYASERIGETVDATMTSVIRSGAFAMADNMIEGFMPEMHMMLPVVPEPSKMCLESFDPKVKSIYVGARIKAKIDGADVPKGKVSFVLLSVTEDRVGGIVEEEKKKAAAEKRSGGKKKEKKKKKGR